MPAARWIGHTAVARTAAVQFGLAIRPSWRARSCAFTSGTTSGTLGSMRKADELSITIAPAARAAGANSRLRPAPALKKAMSMPLKESAFSSSTLQALPLNSSVLPAERAEASSLSEPTGKFRRSRTRRISMPTAPVAPTMAMFGAFIVVANYSNDRPSVILSEAKDLIAGCHAIRSFASLQGGGYSARDDSNLFMLFDRRHQARGIHELAVHQHVVGMRQVMQRERRLHGAHPALRVLGSIHRLLHELQRKQRLLRNALGHGQAERFQLGARHDMVHHAQPMRFGGADPIGGEQEFLGLAHAHLPRMGKELRAAHAHRHRMVEELGVLGADDEIARPHQHQPADHHLAVDQRHRRLGNVAPALAEAEIDLLLAGVLRLCSRLAEAAPGADRLVLLHVAMAVDLAQIVARGEVRTVGRQHDHLHVVVEGGAVEGLVQRVEERRVLRIPGLGPIEDDAGDSA